MRTVLAPTLQALGRRGIALERCAMVILKRDAYATTPGPTIGLAVGERTTYRNGAWILDTFERPTLGGGYGSYPSWGGSAGLTLTGHQVTPTGVGPVGMVTHVWTVPRDPWAAVQLATLSGPSAVGGILLRATATDAYRVTARSVGTTVVESIVAGTATTLATVATPWRSGDVLRAELVWRRLRVYREPILVAEVTVPSPETGLDGRLVGMVAGRIVSGDAVALAQFVAGEARMEYVGAGLDLGDVQRVLGQPASFEVTLSNLAPLGGWPRFAAMLRHGLNEDGTYDLDKGDVRVMTVIEGHAPPLWTGVGWIDGPAEVTEDRVRLAVRGRDAFLTPQLAPGPVTYIPGPAPGGLTPLPPDPCIPALPPTVEPGPPPSEPPPKPAPDGIGPESQPQPPPFLPALEGTWVVEWDYTLGPTAYVGSTTVTQIPDALHAAHGYTDHDFFRPAFQYTLGTGTATAPSTNHEVWVYRGPNIGGVSLVPNFHYGPGLGDLATRSGVNAGYSDGTVNSGALLLTLRLARYVASGIRSADDLMALRPQHPSEVFAPFPARIDTLDEWTISVPFGAANRVLEDGVIPLTDPTGPQLLRLELVGTGWATGSSTRLVFGRVTTYLSSADPNVATNQATSEEGVPLGASLLAP